MLPIPSALATARASWQNLKQTKPSVPSTDVQFFLTKNWRPLIMLLHHQQFTMNISFNSIAVY